MAQTNYSNANGRAVRRPGTMARGEYLSRAHEFCARGQDLPQAKLLDMDVITIRSAVRQRQNLLKYIDENLSNKAIAKQFGISANTLDKVIARATWSHVP